MGLTLKEERQWLRIKKRKLKQMAEKEERGAFFFFLLLKLLERQR